MSRSSGAGVEAYAGARYPERPLRVLWQGRWRNVGRVEHQEQRPDCRCFTVRLAPDRLSRDDTRLRLCYDYANDAWSVGPSPGGRRTVPPEATAT
jgi:hypothetical protein